MLNDKNRRFKALQCGFRGTQCACAAIALGIYSYILAALSNHSLHIKTSARAVEGISGVAVLYTSAAIIVMLCVPVRTLLAFGAMVLDFSFAVAFIYVAAANGTGAGSCRGDVTTQFGTGNSSEKVDNNDNGSFTALPTYGQACQLESAVLGVSIIAIFFFVFSLLLELAMGRQHWHQKRENMVLPDPDGPMGPGGVHLGPEVSEKPGSYTIGHKKKNGGGGFLQRLFGRNKVADSGSDDENMLPQHPTPNEVEQHPPARHDTPVENHNAGETYVFSQSGPAIEDNSISGSGVHATFGYLAPSLYEGMTYNDPYRYDISSSSGVHLRESSRYEPYSTHPDSSNTHAYMSSGALGYDISSRADRNMGTFYPYDEGTHGRISRPT